MSPHTITGRPPTIYRLPQKYLNGNAAEMLFWHAVYYLLAAPKSWTNPDMARCVETDRAELVALTGLSERQVNKELNTIFQQTPPQYRLRQEEGDVRGYTLILNDYDTLLQKHAIRTPADYIRQGWLKLIYTEGDKSGHGRLPLVIVNRLLAQPRGHQRLPVAELCRQCRNPKRTTAPTPADVLDALRFLERLELVQWLAEEAVWELLVDKFGGEAVVASPPDTLDQRRAEDPRRAQAALDVLNAGSFRAAEYDHIFSDLQYLDLDDELPALLALARKWRSKAPSPEAWRDCWRALRHQRQRNQLASEKVRVRLRSEARHTVGLAWPDAARCAKLRFAKLVIRLTDEDDRLRGTPGIRVALSQGGQLLWEGTLTHEDEVKRVDLTGRVAGSAVYALHVAAPAPLPGVGVSLQLEGECARPLE